MTKASQQKDDVIKGKGKRREKENDRKGGKREKGKGKRG